MSSSSSSPSSTMSSPALSAVHPRLPPLYFQQDDTVAGAPWAADDGETVVELPAEILQSILTRYASWGDLAKLATVQSSYRNLLRDAASTSADARSDLARSLLHGTNGLAANPALAMRYLLQLANVEVDDEGFPTKTDDHDGTRHFFGPAMVEIAENYLHGRGVDEPCGPKGLAWMAAAFEFGGDVQAAYRLGVLYERDYATLKPGVVDVDVYAAATWFEAAAEAGHSEAMAELGLAYELGCGKEQSDEKALDWYMKAAEHGNMTAKFSVAEAFEEARGVPQSDEEACLWYYKAAVDGCDDSKQALRRLHDIARIVVPGVGQLFDA